MESRSKKIISTEDCVRVGNFLYFIAYDFNVVMNLNITTGKTSIVGSIPDEETMATRLGAKIVYFNKELYFAPMKAKKIWKYNLESGIWKSYDRKKIEEWAGTEEIFQAVLYKEKIFFIGSCYPAIIKLDIETDKLEYLIKPFEEYKAIAEKKKDCFFRTDIVHLDEKIFIASCLSNKVLQVNLDSFEYEYISVGPQNCSFSGIDYDGEYFYLSPRKGNIAIQWDGRDKWTAINLPLDRSFDSFFTSGSVLCREENVVFSSYFIEKSFVFDRNDNEINTLSEKYWFYKRIDKETLVSLSHNGNITIDFQGNEYVYKLQIERELLIDYLSKRIKENGENYKNMKSSDSIIYEEKDLDLGLFLRMI